MSKERLIGLLIKAILEEYMMESVEDLIVYFLRQGMLQLTYIMSTRGEEESILNINLLKIH